MNLQFVNNPFFLDGASVSELLLLIASDYSKSVTNYMVRFLDTDDMLAMNQQFLEHDTHTDVITFDYSKDDIITAEVFISINKAIDNAKTLGQSIEKEVIRLIIHSFLHCLGLKDKTDSEKIKMRAKEDLYISAFHVKQNNQSHVQ